MTRPAAAGPTIRAPLNAAELSATALTTSSRATVSFTNDCRTTLKSVLARPAHSARTPTCQYATTPVATSVATVSAVHACAAWVAMSRRRLATRSAMAPLGTASSSIGPQCSMLMSPSSSGEFVSDRMSQASATECIQVAIWEVVWATKKTRKSRWRSERRASGRRIAVSVLAGPPAPLGRRHLAYRLAEAPAVALEVERPVGALAPGVVAQLVGNPGTRRDGTLIVRIDVVDLHADELALDAAAHGADRAVVALPADPDQAVAELHRRMEQHAVRAHEPRGRDLAEPERALQERQRGADVLVRNLGNDRRSALGLDLLPDCRHEHCLSSVERRRLERGLAPQLPRQVHRLHRDLTLLSPPGSSSSRRRARARLSRERTVPIGSSRASATLWYESSSHAKRRSASRSPSGSASIASATRENSTRASSAAALARPSTASRPATIRALARSRRASSRRCFSNKFAPIPYSHGRALARDASNVLRRSNAIRNSSPTNPSATLTPARRPRKRSRVAAWRS